MARYFHVTTPSGTTVTKVPENWFPTIAGGMLVLPDGTEVEASAISASRFESKRETPAKDKLTALVAQAKHGFDSVFGDALTKWASREGDPSEDDLNDFIAVNAAYTTWREAELALSKHELNVHKSAEAAKKKKENPTPKAEAKPKAAPKKKK